ncbi:MAG TPA: cation diffusion facilitator family transporter [Thermoplasmata archaeon]|nr:cation diffusion facilitator family transporter [Thermoplasmata archaeon]
MPVHAHGEGEAEARVLLGLRLAVEISFVILALEATGAYLSHSLSLTVDAVHNVPDLLAFGLSWAALRAASGGATSSFTFGAHRFETLAALGNASLVALTGAVFGYEALSDLSRGASFAGTVDPLWLLAVAAPTLLLRSVNLSILRRNPSKVRDLNLSGVIVHLASDLAITAALLASGAVLLLRPSYAWIDPGAALAIAAILVYESVPLFRAGIDVLTDRTPRNLSVAEIERAALAVPGVRGIHDVHVWAVCSSLICLTAHLAVEEGSLRGALEVVAQVRARMEERFGILHSTFEVEDIATAGAPS